MLLAQVVQQHTIEHPMISVADPEISKRGDAPEMGDPPPEI
jgi:hypothetical protein